MKKIERLAPFLIIGLALISLTTAVGIFMENTAPHISEAEERPREYVGRAPVTLRIPSVEVESHVQWVGKNSDGSMANPKGFSDVGWYREGARPGERGSAVIAGHLDNGLGRPAVFFDLDKVAPGDTIAIENDAGEILVFRILRKQTYNLVEFPSEEVFLRTDGAYLNLITCDGTWDESKKSYDKRLVVFSKLISNTN